MREHLENKKICSLTYEDSIVLLGQIKTRIVRESDYSPAAAFFML